MSLLLAGLLNERLFENGDIIEGIRAADHKAMGLAGERPQQVTLGKVIPAFSELISDVSSGNDVQLELRVMGRQSRNLLRGIGQENKSSVAG